MRNVGIIAEYNPLHTGHRYQIDETRRKFSENIGIIIAMSGNWTQQADCAIADKWLRARLAVDGGADLVVELPTPWAMSSAEHFSRGGVQLLHATGVVSHLSFGSESGDLAGLQAVANCLDSQALHQRVRARLASGLSYPALRQQAVESLLGERGGLLAQPNNTLGIEYLRALAPLDGAITPITIPRRGAAHNSMPTDTLPQFSSATAVRHRLLCHGDWDYAARYLGEGAAAQLAGQPEGLPQLDYIQRAILARIRTMTAADWQRYPDSGGAEGLPNRLEQAGRSATSLEGFYDQVKTRRYTHARLRRLVMSAFLGIEVGVRTQCPPYLRVLAFNERGRELLREIKERGILPIVTKPSHGLALSGAAGALFALEGRCTDLYALCYPTVRPSGLEYTMSPYYRRELP